MHLVLYRPEIPPNTGNVVRLCAGMGVPLHLVEPLGFSLDHKHLKRAGLDYWPRVDMRVHADWESLLAHLAPEGCRFVTTSARSGEDADRFAFRSSDAIVLGPETTGLPEELLAAHPDRVRIPISDAVRSLNLSTAAGILLHEALRQTGGLPRD